MTAANIQGKEVLGMPEMGFNFILTPIPKHAPENFRLPDCKASVCSRVAMTRARLGQFFIKWLDSVVKYWSDISSLNEFLMTNVFISSNKRETIKAFRIMSCLLSMNAAWIKLNSIYRECERCSWEFTKIVFWVVRVVCQWHGLGIGLIWPSGSSHY